MNALPALQILFEVINMWSIGLNRKIHFGAGSIKLLPDILAPYKDKPVFLLAFMLKNPAVQETIADLEAKGFKVIADGDIAGEPTTSIMEALIARAKEAGCGSVVSIGGGTIIDYCKGVALLCTNEGTVDDYQFFRRNVEHLPLPHIAVPTTSGTGSETSIASVVYNEATGLKKAFYSRDLVPNETIMDPNFTCGLPKKLTVNCGFDALSHAIETYVSKQANPVTEMYSYKAIELIANNLKKCVEDPNDVEARGNMMIAAYCGGACLNAQTGVAHFIGQPIAGLLHTLPHGEACAIYLPYHMDYTVDVAVEKYCKIARLFGCKGDDSLEFAKEGVAAVKQFLKDLDAPHSIKSYLPPEGLDLDFAVEAVFQGMGHVKSCPKVITREAVREIVAATMKD